MPTATAKAAWQNFLGQISEAATQYLADKGLPDEIKAAYSAFRDKINAALKEMEPVDATEFASNAKWPLDGLAEAIKALAAGPAAAAKAVNAVVDQAADALLKAKVAASELIPAAQHAELLAAAVKNAEAATAERVRKELEAEGARLKLAGDRKALVVQNSLPIPADAILALAGEQFDVARTSAEARAKELKDLGLDPSGALGKRYVWCSDPAEVESLKELISAAAKTTGRKEPLGAPPAGGASTGGTPISLC